MPEVNQEFLPSGKRNILSAEALYDRYAPTLLGLCKRYCGNIEDAEDVLHDGFIKILQNLNRFKQRENGSFEGWMKRIMVNTALNHIRDNTKKRNFFEVDTIRDIADIPEEEENFSYHELSGIISREALLDMVCALPTGYRTVFNLYVFESYTHKEIAEVLGCSENTSKSQLSKARSVLKKQLQRILLQTTV